jgi:hypothetical protein
VLGATFLRTRRSDASNAVSRLSSTAAVCFHRSEERCRSSTKRTQGTRLLQILDYLSFQWRTFIFSRMAHISLSRQLRSEKHLSEMTTLRPSGSRRFQSPITNHYPKRKTDLDECFACSQQLTARAAEGHQILADSLLFNLSRRC